MSLSRPTMSAIRFGYGFRPGEMPPDGPDALLDGVRNAAKEPLRFPVEGIDGRRDTIREHYRKKKAARVKDAKKRRENLRPIRREAFHICGRDQHARIMQSAFSPHAFHERLAVFWTDHFSVSCRKNVEMYLYTPLYEAEAIRPNMDRNFATLLRAAIIHPAMITYLDQTKSLGPNSRRAARTSKGLNENLGRELLELHTLGVDGGYTQQDVRDAALMLTGLGIDRETVTVGFHPQMAEPGPLTFMGKSYGRKRRSLTDIEEMLDDLASRPQTAEHICRKLVVHFISDKPPQPIVDAMVAAWRKSGGELLDVYAAMLNHPLAWDNPGEKARQPYDFIVAGIRALGVPEKALSMPERKEADESDDAAPVTPAPGKMADTPKTGGAMAKADLSDEEKEEMQDAPALAKLYPPLNKLSVGAVRKLGQPVWQPTSPAGFEEGFDFWVTSAQITGRIEWAQRAAARFGGRESPNSLLKAVLNDAARDDTIKVVSQAPNKTAGMALVIASPEFNRR